MNRESELSLEAQRELMLEIIRVARRLEAEGDLYLQAQYMHLKERAEALYSVLELEEGALLPV